MILTPISGTCVLQCAKEEEELEWPPVMVFSMLSEAMMPLPLTIAPDSWIMLRGIPSSMSLLSMGLKANKAIDLKCSYHHKKFMGFGDREIDFQFILGVQD